MAADENTQMLLDMSAESVGDDASASKRHAEHGQAICASEALEAFIPG
jgi:hypothetical protein